MHFDNNNYMPCFNFNNGKLDNRKINNNLQLTLYLKICVVLAFFPWVSFGLNNFDTQPWFLILSLPYVVILLKKSDLHTKILLTFLIGTFIVFFIDIYFNPLHGIRAVATYLSLVLSFVIFDKYLELNQKTRIKILIYVNILWLAYGILQIAELDRFLNLVISRTSETRGETSLAPEPTFFGIFLLFQMIIANRENQIWKKENKRNNAPLLLILITSLLQLIFVAQSSMVILLFLLIVFLWIIIYKTHLTALAILFSLGLFYTLSPMLTNAEAANSRPLVLLSLLVTNPMNIIHIDVSINERLSAIYVSLNGFINNYFVPHGSLQFSEVSEQYKQKTHWIISSFNDKIMSFLGGLFFELGFLGFLFMLYVSKYFKGMQKIKDKIFWLSVLLAILITAVPVGFPLIGYLIAIIGLSYNANRPLANSSSLN